MAEKTLRQEAACRPPVALCGPVENSRNDGSPWGHAFRALGSRNFRLYTSGQLISLVGSWMQQMAMSWLLYRLTHSAMLLGVIAFLGQGPGFFIAPFAGMLADRWNRHRLLVMTQTLSMVQALVLAYVTLCGHVQVWHLFALSMVLGVISGLDIPVRQAFVLDMLDKPEDLSNAISLNSSVYNGSRLIGPAVAGIAVASVGEGWCFFLNGISYIAVIAALLRMRLRPHVAPAQPGSYFAALCEGVAYVSRSVPMRAILALIALVSLVGLPYAVLVPVYAKDILHGGPDTLGYLMGATGAGALTGAAYLATRRDVFGLSRVIPVAAGLFGLGLLGFAQCHVLWQALLLIYLIGLGMMLHLASSNILLQTLVEDSKRGRVMSFYTMSFLGLTPLGSLMIGSLATHIGVAATLILGGGLCMIGALGFAARLSVVRRHVRLLHKSG